MYSHVLTRHANTYTQQVMPRCTSVAQPWTRKTGASLPSPTHTWSCLLQTAAANGLLSTKLRLVHRCLLCPCSVLALPRVAPRCTCAAEAAVDCVITHITTRFCDVWRPCSPRCSTLVHLLDVVRTRVFISSAKKYN